MDWLKATTQIQSVLQAEESGGHVARELECLSGDFGGRAIICCYAMLQAFAK
jgi:hypothetical protein